MTTTPQQYAITTLKQITYVRHDKKKLRYYSLIYEMTDSKCCKCDCYAEMNKKTNRHRSTYSKQKNTYSKYKSKTNSMKMK